MDDNETENHWLSFSLKYHWIKSVFTLKRILIVCKKVKVKNSKRDVSISKWLRVATSPNLTMHGKTKEVSPLISHCSTKLNYTHFDWSWDKPFGQNKSKFKYGKGRNVTFLLAFYVLNIIFYFLFIIYLFFCFLLLVLVRMGY